jgi:cytochrome c oxidase subunit II
MSGPFVRPFLADKPEGLWFPPRASTFVDNVDGTFFMILWICVVFFVLIIGFMSYYAVKYHQPKGGKATSRVRHNNFLEISWSVLPCFLLVIMFLRGSWGFLDQRQPPAGADEISLRAFGWGWSADYGAGIIDPEVHVVLGRPTRMVMRSEDYIHSLFIPAFRLKQDIVPGRYNIAWFEATRASSRVSEEELETALQDAADNHDGIFDPKRYEFTRHGYTFFDLYCAEYCGTDHSRMKSYVVVHETQEDFEQWKAVVNVKPEGMTMEDYGRQLYNQRGCASCHSLDGTQRTGPTFAGTFGGQRRLTTGETVLFDENYVRESILEPNAKIVDGFSPVMPSFMGQLTDQQIDALVAFIKSLRDVN